MLAIGRVLLWTVALIAPGGFLLVPVLAASSLRSGSGAQGWRGRVLSARVRAAALARRLQRYWTKS